MQIDREHLLIKIDLYKETEDNWCSNYVIEKPIINLVKLSFRCINPYSKGNYIWRILCSGTDDIKMYYDGNIFDTVRGIFFDIISEKYINFDNLEKLNFKLY